MLAYYFLAVVKVQSQRFVVPSFRHHLYYGLKKAPPTGDASGAAGLDERT